jgi:hypothetical protein
MLMHNQCLQGNFSSVEILREKCLNQDDKGMSHRIGVAPPPPVAVDYGHRGDIYNRDRENNYSKRTRVERFKLRVRLQKEREDERRLEANDAAVGKKSKITRDTDRDISEDEELALGYYSTKQGTDVMYDERLFNQDKVLFVPKKDVYISMKKLAEFQRKEADPFGLDQFFTVVKKGK